MKRFIMILLFDFHTETPCNEKRASSLVKTDDAIKDSADFTICDFIFMR
jgi:hypothetical protein